MHFTENEIFHIYNRGNNKKPIFFNEANYIFFREKINRHLSPISDILCWCLMPNHFHLLVRANANSCINRKTSSAIGMQELAYRVGILLSSYSQAINKQNGTTGSLFQQKTKAKSILVKQSGNSENYLLNVFHYIHQNPRRAGLAIKLEDWPHCSFNEYYKMQEGLCNKELFFLLSGLDSKSFYEDSYNFLGKSF